MVGNKKVILYCQIGRSLDMTEISIASAIKNAGMSEEDFDIVFICWKTSDEVYGWLKENNYNNFAVMISKKDTKPKGIIAFGKKKNCLPIF